MNYSWQITVAPSTIRADEREFATQVRALVLFSVLHDHGLNYALEGTTTALLGMLMFGRSEKSKKAASSVSISLTI
jgi:hypothetical protein